MAYREFDGKTEAEAVEKACIELGIPKKALRHDVLSHGSTGIFGVVKAKKARIRVKIDDEPPPRPPREEAAAEAVAQSAETQADKPAQAEEKPNKGQRSRKKAAPAEAKAEKQGPDLWPSSTSRPKKAEPAQEGEKAGKSRPSRAARKKKKDAEAKKAALAAEAAAGSGDAHDTGEDAARPAVKPEKPEEAPAAFDPAEMDQACSQAAEIMDRLSKALMDEPQVSAKSAGAGEIILKVDGADAANLIGRKGQTLDAVQHLIETILNKERKPKVRIRVDAGDYLARREENLIKLALRLAEKVKKSGRAASFSPMPAYERRIIHLALKDETSLRTQSKGSGELRKLIIVPRKTEEPKSDT